MKPTVLKFRMFQLYGAYRTEQDEETGRNGYFCCDLFEEALAIPPQEQDFLLCLSNEIPPEHITNYHHFSVRIYGTVTRDIYIDGEHYTTTLDTDTWMEKLPIKGGFVWIEPLPEENEDERSNES